MLVLVLVLGGEALRAIHGATAPLIALEHVPLPQTGNSCGQQWSISAQHVALGALQQPQFPAAAPGVEQQV